jgi:hypothetical protein
MACDLSYQLPINGTFIDSPSMCHYMWYHVIMFLTFGSMSFCLLCITLAHSTCNSSDPTQAHRNQLCIRSALIMLAFSLGFEFVLLTVYIACFICLSIEIVRFILPERKRAAEASRPAQPTTTAPQIVTGCAICLDTVDGPMHTTDCGHTFHDACILKWERGTCPLCRDLI